MHVLLNLALWSFHYMHPLVDDNFRKSSDDDDQEGPLLPSEEKWFDDKDYRKDRVTY